MSELFKIPQGFVLPKLGGNPLKFEVIQFDDATVGVKVSGTFKTAEKVRDITEAFSHRYFSNKIRLDNDKPNNIPDFILELEAVHPSIEEGKNKIQKEIDAATALANLEASAAEVAEAPGIPQSGSGGLLSVKIEGSEEPPKAVETVSETPPKAIQSEAKLPKASFSGKKRKVTPNKDK
jgi:hypothetical protein